MHYSQSPPLAEAFDLDAIAEQRVGKRPVKPSIRSPRSSGLRDAQFMGDRPPVGRRITRTLIRFIIAVLVGVGATLAWQSYGDEARKIVAARAPALASLLPVSTTRSPTMASPDPAQRLELSASNLDAMRRSVELLAVKQDQMAQNIATLQAVEEDIRQKMSSTPPSPSLSQQTAPAVTQPKPPQPRAQSSAVQSSSVPRPPPPGAPLVLSR